MNRPRVKLEPRRWGMWRWELWEPMGSSSHHRRARGWAVSRDHALLRARCAHERFSRPPRPSETEYL